MSFVQQFVSWIFRSIGILLIGFCLILITGIFYSYVYDTCQIYYYTFDSMQLAATLLGIGLWLVFNSLFNFLMSCLVHPGKIPQNFGPDLSKLTQQEIDYIKNGNNINANFNICRKCIRVKPMRAHHCSICNTCILKMDHHCPWINGCVGHNNQRYFLLFLLWVLLGTGWIGMLYLHIQYDRNLYSTSIELCTSFYFNLTGSLCVILFVVLIFFAGWNWYLALTGQTAIEFWGKRLPDSMRHDSSYEYSLSRWYLNLEQIFGTKNIFKIILPSVRDLPHDGTMWLRNSSQIYQQLSSNADIELSAAKPNAGAQ